MSKDITHQILDYQKFVPIQNKCLLTIKETAAYSNIGENKLSQLVLTPNCPFAFFVGSKKLIKRKEFEEFIKNKTVI